MSQFYAPKYTGRYTPEQLDKIALSGEPIDSMGFGYKMTPGSNALESEHYSLRVVNTRGMGNHGTVYLGGKSPHGRRMVWLGKISKLCRSGCTFKVAKIAASSHYGMEEGVWKLAIDLVPLAKAGMSLRFAGRADFENRTGLKADHLSFPRIDAACAIAEKVV